MTIPIALLLSIFYLLSHADVLNWIGVRDWDLREVHSDARHANIVPGGQYESHLYPVSRLYHCMAQIPGTSNLLVFGGFRASVFYDDTWVYSIDSNSWARHAETPAAHPSARTNHPCVSVIASETQEPPRIALHGGSLIDASHMWSDLSDELWVFSGESNTWTELSWPTGGEHHEPKPRTSHALWPRKNGGGLIVFFGYTSPGGYSGSLTMERVEYDIINSTTSSSEWFLMDGGSGAPTNPRSCGNHWVEYEGGRERLWWYGGGSGTMYADLWFYDVPTNAWTAILEPEVDVYPVYWSQPERAGVRTWSGGKSIDRKVFFFGGEGYDDVGSYGKLGDLWFLDLDEVEVGTYSGWTWIRIESTDHASPSTRSPVWEGPTRNPGQRYGLAFAALSRLVGGGDTKVKEVYVYGGARPDGSGADLWSLDVTSIVPDVVPVLDCTNGTLLEPTSIPENLVIDMTFGSGAFGASVLSETYCGATFNIDCYWMDFNGDPASEAVYQFTNVTDVLWTDERLISSPYRRKISAVSLPVDNDRKVIVGSGTETIGLKMVIKEKNVRWFNGDPYVDSVFSVTNKSKTVTFLKHVTANELVTVEQRYDRLLIHGQKIYKTPTKKFEVFFFVYKRFSGTNLETVEVVGEHIPPVSVDEDGTACPLGWPGCEAKKLVIDISVGNCSLESFTFPVHLKLLGAEESYEETVTFTVNLEEICAIEECVSGMEDDENCQYESVATLEAYRDDAFSLEVTNNVEEEEKVFFRMNISSVDTKTISSVSLNDVWVGADIEANHFFRGGSLYDGIGPEWSFTAIQISDADAPSFELEWSLKMMNSDPLPEVLTFSARATVIYTDEIMARREQEEQEGTDSSMAFTKAQAILTIGSSEGKKTTACVITWILVALLFVV